MDVAASRGIHRRILTPASKEYARIRRLIGVLRYGGINDVKHLAALANVSPVSVGQIGRGQAPDLCDDWLADRMRLPVSTPRYNGGHVLYCQHCEAALAEVPCVLCVMRRRAWKFRVVVREALQKAVTA